MAGRGQDEARVGQKTKITRRWARRSSRPRAPKDQRTKSAYIFGAICPARGIGAALVLPKCDSQPHAVAPGGNLITAPWYNITLLHLPPRAPELNPVENVWQFLRDNWLSNTIFKSYDQIVHLSCQAWNRLIDQPWTIMSIGTRDWAHGF